MLTVDDADDVGDRALVDARLPLDSLELTVTKLSPDVRARLRATYPFVVTKLQL